MVTNSKTYEFQTDTKPLLDLMVHSLYTTKDIFLRELISNASDALDRLRFEALTTPALLDQNQTLEIRLEVDRTARTLTISDNGIGMSRDEVMANIGTIAKSGTRELRSQTNVSEEISSLIGQFGVGFYSSFMVADKVVLETRRAGTEEAVRWESQGDNQYTLTETEKATTGTSITLYLKPPDAETGIEDYTDKWILARIVKRYSDFVSYPVVYVDEENKVLNTMKPLWKRPAAEVTTEEYAQFYRNMFHDFEDPLLSLHLKAEGIFEYQVLLFTPPKAPQDLYYQSTETDLRLYARGVLIMERCTELLPRYLRFIKGVVDSADLPLNISRQMLQQDRHITQIRKWIVTKLLNEFTDLAAKDPEKYRSFWEQFGRPVKEGMLEDRDNRETLVPLLLFESSNDAEKLTTLKDYVGRMKPDQEQIFYLTGDSRAVIENSPHLEAFKEKGYEVLYLTDPVDELLVQSLPEVDGHKLKSVGKGTIELGSEEEKEQQRKQLEEQQTKDSDLLELLQKRLDTHVKQVRLTNRLTTSPVCLVAGMEFDDSPFVEKLLQRGKGGGPKQRRIMELNPKHDIYLKMEERFRQNASDPLLNDYADLLFGYAQLAEGSEITDPVQFNHVLASLLTRGL
ncbi:MAG TPA: molecular chaperone HtpG [Pyrinomonadaceae bacterium]